MKLGTPTVALLITALLGGCYTVQPPLLPEEVTEVRILIDGENQERLITDQNAIDELTALITSLPPVKKQIAHGAVTYSTANTKRIEFVSSRSRTREFFYIGTKTIRTQHATWPVGEEMIQKINRIIANRAVEKPPIANNS